MTDIVERLELQAFVADKIQSGMKPLIMDCLEEITHLRCQYEALLNQAEMNARLLTENASLRGEVEMLRRDVKTAVMGDSAELTDVKRENEKLREELNCWHEAANWPEKSPHALRAENEKLRAAFRVNMLRAFPHMSHDEIDAEIAAAIRESGDE